MFKKLQKVKSRLSGLPPVCSQDCTDNKNGTFTCSCFDPRLTVVNGTHCVADKDREFKIFLMNTFISKKKKQKTYFRNHPQCSNSHQEKALCASEKQDV